MAIPSAFIHCLKRRFLFSDTRGEIVYFKVNTHGQIKYNLMYRSSKTEVLYCRLSGMEVD
jgi:hypothetical protein